MKVIDFEQSRFILFVNSVNHTKYHRACMDYDLFEKLMCESSSSIVTRVFVSCPILNLLMIILLK